VKSGTYLSKIADLDLFWTAMKQDISLPNPLAAPVTMATFPEILPISTSYFNNQM